jgi:O-antigen/teichoic acid export membrane protein
MLTGSNIAVQFVTVAALPILTRLYRPVDFGTLAIFSSIAQIIVAISGLRYEICIPNAPSDERAVEVISIALGHVVLMTALAAVFVGAGALVSQNFLQFGSLGSHQWFLPLAVLMGGIYNVLQFYAIREKAYTVMARTRVMQSVSAVGLQVGTGWLLPGPLGLIGGFILQTGAGAVTLIRHMVANPRYRFGRLTISAIRSAYRTNLAYLKYSTPEAILHMGAMQVPLLMIGAMVSPAEAGYLFMANRVMQLPVTAVSGSFAQTFSAEAAEAYRTGVLPRLLTDSLTNLLSYVVGPVMLVGTLCWSLLPMVFGARWEPAGEIALWLSAGICVQIMASATGAVFYVRGKEATALLIHAMGFVVRVLPTYYAARFAPEMAAKVFALTGLIHYGLYLLTIVQNAEVTAAEARLVIRGCYRPLLLWLGISTLLAGTAAFVR